MQDTMCDGSKCGKNNTCPHTIYLMPTLSKYWLFPEFRQQMIGLYCEDSDNSAIYQEQLRFQPINTITHILRLLQNTMINRIT